MKLSRTVFHNFSFVGNVAICNPEDGLSMFIRNVDIYLRGYTVSQPTTRTQWSSPQLAPHVSLICRSGRLLLHEIYNTKPVSFIWFPVCTHAANLNTISPFLLVAGYCYGMLSYKAPHATGNIFWCIVLSILLLIIPDSSTRFLYSRFIRDT
jgi:hypothetical protein